MKRLIPIFLVLVTTSAAVAQLRPPERTVLPVLDASMVIMDRGSRLEVYPDRRAVPHADSLGRGVLHEVIHSNASAAIGPAQLGVVFNHEMQQQGYISGEITVKLKPGHSATALRSSSYPGFKKITSPEVYVVNARTPAEFLSILKSLQARTDLEWVEPTVEYGPAGLQPSSR